MNLLRDQRRQAIGDLIRGHALRNQDELGARLSALGFSVTQATVSRDLEHLRAVKVRRDGEMAYALPEMLESRVTDSSDLARILRDWVRSIDCAGNLVVIKTPPGSAHLIGVALDRAQIREIVGTICGDDTIFVACRGSGEAKGLASDLSALRGEYR